MLTSSLVHCTAQASRDRAGRLPSCAIWRACNCTSCSHDARPPLALTSNTLQLARQATDPIDSLLAATLWRRDLDQSLAAETIMKISTARGKIAEVVGGMVAREDLSADTLFRSNTPFTKVSLS